MRASRSSPFDLTSALYFDVHVPQSAAKRRVIHHRRNLRQPLASPCTNVPHGGRFPREKTLWKVQTARTRGHMGRLGRTRRLSLSLGHPPLVVSKCPSPDVPPSVRASLRPRNALTLVEQIHAAWQTIAMRNTHAISLSRPFLQLADRPQEEILQLKQAAEDEARAIAHCRKVAAPWPALFQTIHTEVDTANAHLRLHKFAFAELPVRENDQIAVCGFTSGDVRLTLSVCAYSSNIGLAHFKGAEETYRSLSNAPQIVMRRGHTLTGFYPSTCKRSCAGVHFGFS